jgi:hypothetical protein
VYPPHRPRPPAYSLPIDWGMFCSDHTAAISHADALAVFDDARRRSHLNSVGLA